jgi:hypothetical protein
MAMCFVFALFFAMNLGIVLIHLVVGQGSSQPPSPSLTTSLTPSSTISTSSPLPTSSSRPGTQAERARACTQGSTTLVNAYKQCFPLFPFTASSTIEADDGALTFIRCLCATEWRAGSVSQIRSSVPICPPIPGISKGQQAAVAADCGSGLSQQGRVVQNFGLRTFVQRKPYVPLSGLPLGVTSSAMSQGCSLIYSVLFIII